MPWEEVAEGHRQVVGDVGTYVADYESTSLVQAMEERYGSIAVDDGHPFVVELDGWLLVDVGQGTTPEEMGVLDTDAVPGAVLFVFVLQRLVGEERMILVVQSFAALAVDAESYVEGQCH
jgi:hypothetical protein